MSTILRGVPGRPSQPRRAALTHSGYLADGAVNGTGAPTSALPLANGDSSRRPTAHRYRRPAPAGTANRLVPTIRS